MHPLVLFTMLTASIHVAHSALPISEAHLEVIPPRVAELVEASELIVLAKVESVSEDPNVETRRAKATVLEVWKGPRTTSVEYRVWPTFACDIAYAKKGETVLLFLEKEETGWGITWAGRGRMPLVEMNNTKYLSYFSDVIFPDETPWVRTAEEDKRSFDQEGVFEQAVEMKLVKELVRKASERKREGRSRGSKDEARQLPMKPFQRADNLILL
ncbi:hypothetical protein [Paludisphaera mucosa]|uniref:Uncharacterized protein n=1 Tax=Paludisphaera mucosa TaxID=3030827 RepID=A0ABT6F4Y5_9BACT|nr:hypothetical protein [Paludisphaera mucosa]MDG3002479.1 hypothetical protein [Paludisphaera mucosa]